MVLLSLPVATLVRSKRVLASTLTLYAAFAILAPGVEALSLSNLPSRPEIPVIVSKVAVFGSDDRIKLPESHIDLAQKIGTLTSRKTGASCTAFCVGADLIATASHCLFGTSESAKPDVSDIEFALHTKSGTISTLLAGSDIGTTKQNIISGTEALAVRPPIEAANDWAIARTRAAVCRAGGLAFSRASRQDVSNLGAANAVYQVAVHRDLPGADLMLAKPCGLARSFAEAGSETIDHDFLNAEAIIFHTCDTGGGSSGSPLLSDGPNGPEVIGINVGTYVLSRMVLRAGGKTETEPSQPIANTAVETPRFAGAVTELAARDLLRTATEIRGLQAMLKKYDLYRPPLGGQFTGGLEAAIKRFEVSSGRQPSGLPRRALLQEIAGWANQTGLVKAKY